MSFLIYFARMATDKKNVPEDAFDIPDIEMQDFVLPVHEPIELEIQDPIELTVQDHIELKLHDSVELNVFDIPDSFTTSEVQPPRQPDATSKQVAAWMKAQVQNDEYLYQQSMVCHIEEEFGDKFIYTNGNGNRAISTEVLNEFRKLTPNLVWSRSGFYWRRREDYDDSKKRQVE
jgi:hypothetical protein